MRSVSSVLDFSVANQSSLVCVHSLHFNWSPTVFAFLQGSTVAGVFALCLDSFRAKLRLGDWPLCQRAKRLPRFSQLGAGQVPAPDPFLGFGLLLARLWCAHRTAPVPFCLLHFWRCQGHRSSLWFFHPAGACVLSPICGLQSN
jgi:hypothetical protein